jgi:hypothetical protein
VVAQNFGPAPARDVVVEYWFVRPDGQEIETPRPRHSEPFVVPGQVRRFLPRGPAGIETLSSFADQGLVLGLRWEWSDGHRTLRQLVRRKTGRHEASATHSVSQYRDDLHRGRALTHGEPLDEIEKELKKLREAVEAFEK